MRSSTALLSCPYCHRRLSYTIPYFPYRSLGTVSGHVGGVLRTLFCDFQASQGVSSRYFFTSAYHEATRRNTFHSDRTMHARYLQGPQCASIGGVLHYLQYGVSK